MKTYPLLLIALSMSFTASADEIQIPFSVYMEKFKTECKTNGLDLYGNDNSNGFVADKGSSFTVFTYRTCPPEQLGIIQEATWKTLRK